jgi:hypothetical protein
VPIPSNEAKVLADRWQATLAQIVQKHVDAFAGTDFDPAVARQKMEKLLARVETYLTDVREEPSGLSATEALAAKLRSALASNAMGGRASDEAKWRSAAEAVKEAQVAFDRLVPIAGSDAKSIESKFREACRRILDHARRANDDRRHSQKPSSFKGGRAVLV